MGGRPASATSDRPAPTSSAILRPGLTVVAVRAEVQDLVVPAQAEHAVLVNVGPPYRLVETLDDLTRETLGHAGDVAVVPAGLQLAVRSRGPAAEHLETLAFLVAPELVGEVLDSAGARSVTADLVPALGARSPQVAQLASLVQAAMPDETALGRLARESLGHALAVAVAREHVARAAGRPVEQPDGGLSRPALDRVLHHIDEHLAAPLSVTELAALVHISPFHFARLFRRSTGMSPYQYVVRRRVGRARELIVGSTIPLAEVASRCGFADQSHLTRHTRRQLGTTPAALRASRWG